MDGERIDPQTLVKVYNIFDPSFKIFTQEEINEISVKDEELEYLTGDMRPTVFVAENGDFHFTFSGGDLWVPAKGNTDAVGYTYDGPYCFLNANIANLCANHMVDRVIMLKEQYDDVDPKTHEKIKVQGGRNLGNHEEHQPLRQKYLRQILPDAYGRKVEGTQKSQLDKLREDIQAAADSSEDDAFSGLNAKKKRR